VTSVRGRRTVVLDLSAEPPRAGPAAPAETTGVGTTMARIVTLAALERAGLWGEPADYALPAAAGRENLLGDPSASALLRLEASLLLEALQGDPGQACREAARDYAVVRAARRARLPPERAGAELRLEGREGMVLYLNLRSLELIRDRLKDREEMQGEEASGAARVFAASAAAAKEAWRTLLERTAESGYRVGEAGLQALGAGEAMLMDRLDSQWKARLMETPGRAIEDLLCERLSALGCDPGQVSWTSIAAARGFAQSLARERIALWRAAGETLWSWLDRLARSGRDS
jgi:hypothetical protein